MAHCLYCSAPLPAGAQACPACGTEVSDVMADAGRAGGTRLQSVDEASFVALVPRIPTRKETEPGGRTPLFRPRFRPPMAVVCVHDDCQTSGEVVRVRGDRLTLGRSKGDIVIPHDSSISGQHCEVLRRNEDGEFVWYVRDLGSTNGTFARLNEGVLKHGHELLLGTTRYRFDAAPSDPKPAGKSPPGGTRKWHAMTGVPRDFAGAALVEVGTQGDGRRFPLPGASCTVGSDASACDVVLAEDAYLNPRHAKFYRDPKGRWHVEAAKDCVNGVWARITAIRIDSSGTFQIGEQRFSVKVP